MKDSEHNNQINIKDCTNCPFSYENEFIRGYGCKIDNEKRKITESEKFQPITPNWCPVKKSDVIIKYDKNLC